MKQLIVLAAVLALGLSGPVNPRKVKFGESREEMWRMFTGGKTVEEKLMSDLMKDYNKYVKPTGVTNLHFSLSFICSHLDTKDLMINTRVLEKYEWNDMRLKWNPTEHNNIRKIRIPAFMIWTPDIKLMNSHKMTEDRDMDVNCIITSDGKVTFMPMVTYKTHCMKEHEMFMQNIMGHQTGGKYGTVPGNIHGGVHQGVHGNIHRGGIHGGQTGLKEELMNMNLGGKSKSSESSSSESSSEEIGLKKNTNTFTCKLVLGSWTYDDKLLRLTLLGEGHDKTFYSDMCPGDITDLKVRIKDNVFPESPDEKYPAMIVDFKLKDRMI